MEAYPLMKICQKIRNNAKSESIVVQRNSKSEEWKNKLLILNNELNNFLAFLETH